MQYSNTITSVPNADNVWCIDFSNERSKLIKRLEWSEKTKELSVYVKYSENPYVYESVERSIFEEFTKTESLGKFYLDFIKPNFKLIKHNFMSDEKKQLPTKNQASNETRFIDIDINVRNIIKQWIFPGEKGDYLKLRLVMKPDGEVDKFGALGFVTQPVPSELYKAAEKEKKGSGKNIESPILGNAREIDWEAFRGGNSEDTNNLTLGSEPVDDLPF